MPIPDAPIKPSDSLETRTALVYSDPGLGKSTLLSEIPNSIFIATEKGLDQITAMRWQYQDGAYVIKDWHGIYQATAEIIASKRFKTIIIDTLGNLCWLAQEFVCAKYGEAYKADGKLGYGKGAALIINELKRYFQKLTAQNVGCWMTAHAVEETVETRTGKYDRHIPFIPGDNKKQELLGGLVGMVDMVLYGQMMLVESNGKKEQHRVLRTQPNVDYIAKVRGEKGARPMLDPVPMTWAGLSKAFELTKKPATPEEIARLQTEATRAGDSAPAAEAPVKNESPETFALVDIPPPEPTPKAEKKAAAK